MAKEESHTQSDLYEILGVAQDATQEQIKKSYNELVLLHHPDKGGDAKKFKDLQIAYKVLSNEKNRALYTKSLSSTFSEITGEYRDKNDGKHVALSYDVSDNDFTKAASEEEVIKKKAEFMRRFDDQREEQEKILLEKCDKMPAVLDYAELLKQHDDVLDVPRIDCLMTRKFDVNMFNQLFEENKKTGCRDLEQYHEILEQHRTDLAPIDSSSIFTKGIDADKDEKEFQTYGINGGLNKTSFDAKKDVTRTKDIVYEDLEIAYKQRMMERCIDKSKCTVPIDEKTGKPPGWYDSHQFSYDAMVNLQ
jgi:hypothetical protein